MAELFNERIREEQNDDVGGKIRALRKEKDITLKQLGKETGLSIGYLSNLERDACSPTLDNLQKICGVLEISLIELLDGMNQGRRVIRKEERKVVFEKPGKVRYESIKFGSGLLDGLVIELEPHSQYDSNNWVHNYDEIGLILEGKMYVSIDGEQIELEEGDAFYIKAKANHSLGNNSDTRCVSYWVKSI